LKYTLDENCIVGFTLAGAIFPTTIKYNEFVLISVIVPVLEFTPYLTVLPSLNLLLKGFTIG